MSTVVIPNGIDLLDISSAAMGAESTTPVGATKQPYEYPRWGSSSSVFRFDPVIYGMDNFPGSYYLSSPSLGQKKIARYST